jgi:hypothetical protein
MSLLSDGKKTTNIKIRAQTKKQGRIIIQSQAESHHWVRLCLSLSPHVSVSLKTSVRYSKINPKKNTSGWEALSHLIWPWVCHGDWTLKVSKLCWSFRFFPPEPSGLDVYPNCASHGAVSAKVQLFVSEHLFPSWLHNMHFLDSDGSCTPRRLAPSLKAHLGQRHWARHSIV